MVSLRCGPRRIPLGLNITDITVMWLSLYPGSHTVIFGRMVATRADTIEVGFKLCADLGYRRLDFSAGGAFILDSVYF